MQAASPSVFNFLKASSSAEVTGALDLGLGRSAVIWRNAHDRMRYERPDGCTFSVYLKGGTGTKRLDRSNANGWPGALCVMPEGASSEWEITEAFEFAHVYLPDAELRRFYAEAYDRDARLMTMAEATFVDAPNMANALRCVAGAVRSADLLLADAAVTDAILNFFESPSFSQKKLPALKGGLTPAMRRRVIDYIEEHLGAPLTLNELAGVAGLSEFHLQRMFSASCGISPHSWIMRRRVERAKALLGTKDSIAQIASACGFSSQSHLTTTFKGVVGMTPLAYRRAVRTQAGRLFHGSGCDDDEPAA